MFPWSVRVRSSSRTCWVWVWEQENMPGRESQVITLGWEGQNADTLSSLQSGGAWTWRAASGAQNPRRLWVLSGHGNPEVKRWTGKRMEVTRQSAVTQTLRVVVLPDRDIFPVLEAWLPGQGILWVVSGDLIPSSPTPLPLTDFILVESENSSLEKQAGRTTAFPSIRKKKSYSSFKKKNCIWDIRSGRSVNLLVMRKQTEENSKKTGHKAKPETGSSHLAAGSQRAHSPVFHINILLTFHEGINI